jgi:radical SAM superfamily enzyme YgiQ (UPF0313 family)
MRITLVDNLIMPAVQDLNLLDLHPHLGLLSLAAVAEASGHRVTIYDPKRRLKKGLIPYDENLYRLAVVEILEQQPEAIGFTTLGCSFLFVLRTAELLKRAAPGIPILLGGPHATMLADEILRDFDCFDVIVKHEAEDTFPQVLRNLPARTFDMIPGISWRTAGGRTCFSSGSPRIEEMDRLPIVSYSHYPVEELDLDLLRVEAGRGCPYDCTFCSTAQFFQRRYRLKSPARLLTELDRLHARYGMKEFKLDHDLFTVDRKKVLAFCEAVKGRGYRWRVSARIDRVDSELLRAMADAGCVGLYFGVETGSRRLQRVVQKHLDLDLVEPILDEAAALGIQTTVSLITGYPDEDGSDLDASLDLLGRAFLRSPDTCIPQFHLLTPEPGTPLFSQFGDGMLFDGHPGPFNARILSQADRDLVLNYPRLFTSYHYYQARLPRWRHTSAVQFVDMLRSFDRSVLREALERFSGRLSKWIHATWSLADGQEWDKMDPEMMMSCMTAALSGLTWPFGAYSPAGFYRLSPWARIEEGAGEGYAYLVAKSAAATTTRRVSHGLAYIVEMFRMPRTVASVMRQVEQATGSAFSDDMPFRELVQEHVLIPAEPFHGDRT